MSHVTIMGVSFLGFGPNLVELFLLVSRSQRAQLLASSEQKAKSRNHAETSVHSAAHNTKERARLFGQSEGRSEEWAEERRTNLSADRKKSGEVLTIREVLPKERSSSEANGFGRQPAQPSLFWDLLAPRLAGTAASQLGFREKTEGGRYI